MNNSDSFRDQVMTELRAVESDLSKPHRIDFYLYFPTEELALKAKSKLGPNFTAEVRDAAMGPDWLCLAQATLIPESAPLDEIGARFRGLADELSGEFDGWEAETVLE